MSACDQHYRWSTPNLSGGISVRTEGMDYLADCRHCGDTGRQRPPRSSDVCGRLADLCWDLTDELVDEVLAVATWIDRCDDPINVRRCLTWWAA